jgi:hypothetical protein
MTRIPKLPALFLLSLILLGASSRGAERMSGGSVSEFGVLLMAHGGSVEWNQAVLEAVAPLRSDYPVEVAFGMADASTIQEAVSLLESQGVREIGVVRLFVSGESWYERTKQILGISPGGPTRPEAEEAKNRPVAHPHSRHTRGGGRPAQDGEGNPHESHARKAFWRIDTDASFSLSTQGLAEVPEMGDVLAERAMALSHTPEVEDVLILAHGPAEDPENERWIASIEARADAVRKRFPFRRVEVQTLREDWPEKRKIAEEQIRFFVQRAEDEGGRAIVMPFRVYGFGPYAEILEGLEYVSDGLGLLPHSAVTRWVRQQASSLRSGPFHPPLN